MTQVWHYDGTNAVRHVAELIPELGGFRLASGDAFYPWISLEHRGIKGGKPYYGLANVRGWQIGFIDPVPATIVDKLPKALKYGKWIDHFGLGRASIALLTLSASVAFIAVKAPEWVAPLVPIQWERNMGEAMVGDFGGRLCHGPGGKEAIKALLNRLEPHDTPVEVDVANISMVNAVSLPGGRIIIFQGLLQEAKSADEIAGVLGHEIGHVRHRDVMQALLREAGLSVLMGGISGNANGYANALLSSTYSRDAETKADFYSINALRTANISPEDTAGFFTRLAADEKKLGAAKAALGYVSSHPLSESREKEFRMSKKAGHTYQPTLTAAQWNALLNICRNDPHVKPDRGFLF
ncbi:MAG: hypothetical protein RLZZ366_212 [Pseudomonadota bacterium]|jgi:beta-barrel assembly-enhancing protease